jgi:hypothetical protein
MTEDQVDICKMACNLTLGMRASGSGSAADAGGHQPLVSNVSGSAVHSLWSGSHAPGACAIYPGDDQRGSGMPQT